MAKSSGKVTPLMRQYAEMKAEHPDAILLYRVGDFYETFGEDAERAAGVLGITLTSRNNGGSDVPLAGFPYHSLEVYLPKLVRAGFRVALCEQLEKPSKERKVVRRGITELITPGIAQGDNLLEQKRNNFLAAVAPDPSGDRFGLAFVDVSTGEFLVAQGDRAYLDKLLQGMQPSEVVLPKGFRKSWEQLYGDEYYAYPLEDWIFEPAYAHGKVVEQFRVASLRGFGMEAEPLLQTAAGAVLHYLTQAKQAQLSHLATIRRLSPEQHVWLDRFTVRNLELVEPSSSGGRALVDELDATQTPMGARLLRRWLLLPLTDLAQIERRHHIVATLASDVAAADRLQQLLKSVGDLERLVGKVATQRATPRELWQLLRALRQVPEIVSLPTESTALREVLTQLDPCSELAVRIGGELSPDAPALISKGDLIADGVDGQLDAWRSDVINAQGLLDELRQREVVATGITSLKVGFNNVFGYYFEVTNRYKGQDLVPEGWHRKQTLSNAERYVSDELKVLEERILGAGDKIQEREEEIFARLLDYAKGYVVRLQHSAHLLAQLDVLWGFAHLAKRRSWVQPKLNLGFALELRAARHPVIEAGLKPGNAYVPNDISLDPEGRQILMITGPNMSGKSAILRQTALAVLMAQIGCFVAADSADIGLVDKVFTRVGASDNLSGGESTFMVEMNETASIMNNVGPRSLVLLDEIGRGTSTFDGVSIAWSIAEYLHALTEARPKTLFATHYHELNALASRLPGVHNMHVSTQELGDRVIFLRKLTDGGSRHSFGIHVARMAGMPTSIIVRAGEVLAQLERQRMEQGIGEEAHESAETGMPGMVQVQAERITRPMQLSIFEAGDPKAAKLRSALEDLDLDNLTPIAAMTEIFAWRKMLSAKG